MAHSACSGPRWVHLPQCQSKVHPPPPGAPAQRPRAVYLLSYAPGFAAPRGRCVRPHAVLGAAVPARPARLPRLPATGAGLCAGLWGRRHPCEPRDPCSPGDHVWAMFPHPAQLPVAGWCSHCPVVPPAIVVQRPGGAPGSSGPGGRCGGPGCLARPCGHGCPPRAGRWNCHLLRRPAPDRGQCPR